MPRYLVPPREKIFEKGYGFLSFAKKMVENTGINISKNLSDKYSQTLFDHAKQSATYALKTTSKRLMQKAAKATADDLIGNKIADRIIKVSKNSPQYSLEI